MRTLTLTLLAILSVFTTKGQAVDISMPDRYLEYFVVDGEQKRHLSFLHAYFHTNIRELDNFQYVMIRVNRPTTCIKEYHDSTLVYLEGQAEGLQVDLPWIAIDYGLTGNLIPVHSLGYLAIMAGMCDDWLAMLYDTRVMTQNLAEKVALEKVALLGDCAIEISSQPKSR